MSDDPRTILLIGSGPIRIGQAAEFDYSGAQACRALAEEGVRVVLVNSNPATIMTDPDLADETYVEPISPETITPIIEREQPDGIIAGLGGQTGLNVTAELAEAGVLDEYGVEILGTPLDTIYATEDRELFRKRLQTLDEPVPRSITVESVDAVEAAVEKIGGLPVIMRTTYTLGGSGSGVIGDLDELRTAVSRGLRLSRNDQVLLTESIAGWIELEYEVMRDAEDSCIIICNMENLDPMGIHTGESIVVTPSQVIPDAAHQEMRWAAIRVIRDLEIHGGCNIQFAWRDDGSRSGEYRVVEVNPRVSRSSALASKATGYPIARVTAKIALGKSLHEIENEVTGETTAAFEPAIDYVVTKIPRWPQEKFRDVDFTLGTAMKSTGEAMAIGRTFEESLQKALRSIEYSPATDLSTIPDDQLETEFLDRPTPDRPFAILEAFDRGYEIETVGNLTGIEPWYLERFRRIAMASAAARDGDFQTPAQRGYTDQQIASLVGEVDREAIASTTPERTFNLVDTCAGEFTANTPYFYSTRSYGHESGTSPVETDREVESVLIVGAGPIRIGQGVEFDYCTVHAVQALREDGIEAYIVNNNPETVSTDYDTSDGLFFDPITAEEVADVLEVTGADGVMVQFGGQTSVNVGAALEREIERRSLSCEILGTSIDAMDLAEDRNRFNALLAEHDIRQPEGGTATSESESLQLARDIGYPVLVRPSYVLGGRAMEIVHSDAELRQFVDEAVRVGRDKPILIDEFLKGGIEIDVDAVCDGEDVLVGGISEHVETAGIHSGDSACMIPPRSLGRDINRQIREVTESIARALSIVGLLNVQLAVAGETVYVLEANPRSSRTVPFVSKATGVPIAKIAARVMTGERLAEMDVHEQVPNQYSVKEVVLPFDRLSGSDPRLGPEMKSTGEVMTTAESVGMAYFKAQMAVGKPIPTEGAAVIDLKDSEFPDTHTVEGRELRRRYGQHFELLDFQTEEEFIEAVRDDRIDFIVSRRRRPLQAAVEEQITYVSTVASAMQAIEAIEAADESLAITSLTDRPRRNEFWGQPKSHDR